MKFSVASVLALATVAIAAPTKDHGGHRCEHLVCTNNQLLALDLDVDVLGLLDLDLGLILGGHKTCRKLYCCPSRCEKGKRIPDTCYPWY